MIERNFGLVSAGRSTYGFIFILLIRQIFWEQSWDLSEKNDFFLLDKMAATDRGDEQVGMMEIDEEYFRILFNISEYYLFTWSKNSKQNRTKLS